MKAVQMPIDGMTGAIVGVDFQLWRLGLPVIPALDDATVGAESKFDAVGRRPFHVTHAVALAIVGVLARAGANMALQISHIPQLGGAILTAGKQESAMVRIESKLVDLSRVLVKAGKLHFRSIDVIQDHSSAAGRRSDQRVEGAVGPFDVVDVQRVLGAGAGGVVRCILAHCSEQVELFGAVGAMDQNRLEDVAAGEDGTCAVRREIQRANLQARPMRRILGGQRPRFAQQEPRRTRRTHSLTLRSGAGWRAAGRHRAGPAAGQRS